MADIRTFNLPDLGEGLEEGDVVEWLVEVGDVVDLNQEIVTVETAKAAVDIPVPFAGKIVEKAGEAGDTLTVGEMLCRIDVAATASPSAEPAGTTSPSAEAGASANEQSAGTAVAEQPQSSERSEEDYDTPGLGSGGKGSTGLDAEGEPQPLVGYGNKEEGGGRRRRRGAPAAPTSSSSADAGASASAEPQKVERDGPPLAKPPVRKLAKDQGIDLAYVQGSGPQASITREDLAQYAAQLGSPTAPTPPPPSAPAAPQQPAATAPQPTLTVGAAGEKAVPGFRGRTPGEVEKVAGIRKRIIAKMEQSRRDIPHALCSTDADVTDLWELRRDLTADARAQGFDVKITPYVVMMRATVLALRRFPTLNAVYDQDAGEIRLLEHINLGVAVDTDRGLIVANIKDAHTKSTLQLALEAQELAEKCRNGTATPAELTGGTFTTDNYGYFGNDDGNPIINAPEVGILGIGAMRERPWVHDSEIAVRRVTRFQLAFDHRVCDGGEAGRFVTYVAELCENPGRILLHT